MFYCTPGDELDFFIFNGPEVAYKDVRIGGFYYIRVIGARERNAGIMTTYGKNGIASLFKFVLGPNDFGNCVFEDEKGCKLLLREFSILNGETKFFL